MESGNQGDSNDDDQRDGRVGGSESDSGADADPERRFQLVERIWSVCFLYRIQDLCVSYLSVMGYTTWEVSSLVSRTIACENHFWTHLRIPGCPSPAPFLELHSSCTRREM
eukprot:g54135.t1